MTTVLALIITTVGIICGGAAYLWGKRIAVQKYRSLLTKTQTEIAYTREELDKAKHEIERLKKRALETFNRSRQFLAFAPVLVYAKDVSSNEFLYVSEGASKLLGYNANRIQREPFESFVHPNDRERVAIAHNDHTNHGCVEFRMLHADGRYVWVRDVFGVKPNPGARLEAIGFVSSIEEERKQKDYVQLLTECIDDGVWDWNVSAEELYLSPSWKAMFGYMDADFGNTIESWRNLLIPEDQTRFDELVARLNQDVQQRPTIETVLRFRHRDGSIIHGLVRGRFTYDSKGSTIRVLGSVTDVTKIKEQESKIAALAMRDPLTGLPNRALINETIEQLADYCQPRGDKFAIHLLDLDHFKDVNDSMGHTVGDELLKQVSNRLFECLRADDIVARLGGDEFIIIQKNIDEPSSCAALATKVIGEISKPYIIDEQKVRIGTSVGVAIFPLHGFETESLLSHADMAMYRAKDDGRNRFKFYEHGMAKEVKRRKQLDKEIESGIHRQEFLMHYQPIVKLNKAIENKLRTGEWDTAIHESQSDDEESAIVMESLMRWKRSNEQGLTFPGDFIDVAEEKGHIIDLTYYAIEYVCRDLASNKGEKLEVSINVPPAVLLDDFEERVVDILSRTEVEPRRILFEITETGAMKDAPKTKAVIENLQKKGFRFLVDDFGTGYSSLDYLQKFHFDRLKIDRSFIHNHKESASIIKSIVSMAHSMGMKVVAEGVETRKQLEFLQSLGVDYAQGFLFSRPKPLGELLARAQEPRRRASDQDRII